MKRSKIIRTVIYAGQEPTPEQIREIEMASVRPAIPDEEVPELNPEQYNEIADIVRKRLHNDLGAQYHTRRNDHAESGNK